MGKQSVCSTAAKDAINEVLILCQPKRGPKHMFHKRCDSHRDHTATKGFRINEFIILYQKECFQIMKETTLLVDEDNYFICQSMKKKIDNALKKKDREAAATNAASNPGTASLSSTTASRPNPTGGVGDGDVTAADPGTSPCNTNAASNPNPIGGGGGVTAEQ